MIALIDGNDPTARHEYIERHGIVAYEAAMEDWFARTTVATENGYRIRVVVSARFGRIYMVDGLGRGHGTAAGAVAIAKAAPRGKL